ncbi:ciliary microtubule inner protein 4 [Aquarana catesbeiana]|uniref:ciliary microtubule inner protein 4 n=1 Tax=Aquarana catesbeiana TaxID=8400 RepID=UPI003CC9D1CC
MEANSGPMACYSAPPDIKEKWKAATIENKTGQSYRCSKHNDVRVLSSRNKISPEAVDICQSDIRNLIPANIRHKYGSSLVEQLISPTQVRKSLADVEQRTRNTPRVTLTHVTLKPWLMEEYPHRIYYELSHCLRSNVFPGMPIKQHSLVQDSYTAEVNERGRRDKGNNQHWYGRKTDDLALWSQQLMKRNNIAKILESQQKTSLVFPLHIHPTVLHLQDDPPAPAPKANKPRKPKQAKAKKPKAPTPPVIQPDQDDDFWDFYDKPIP